GVDMIYASGDDFAQNGNCCLGISWRPEDSGTSELHCAVTHAVHIVGGAWKSENATEIHLFGHCMFLSILFVSIFLESFSDHLFAFLPKRFGVLGIECVPAPPAAHH